MSNKVKQSENTPILLLIGFFAVYCICVYHYFHSTEILSIALAPISNKHVIVYLGYVFFVHAIFVLFVFLVPLFLFVFKQRLLNILGKYFFFLSLSLLCTYTFINTQTFIINGTHVLDDYVLSALQSKNFLREVNIPTSQIVITFSILLGCLSLFYLSYRFIKIKNNTKLAFFVIISIAFTSLLFFVLKNRWQLREMERALFEPYISSILVDHSQTVYDEEYLAGYTKTVDNYKQDLQTILPETLKHKTVLIIHIESLRKDFVTQEYMPFLNDLVSKSTIKSQYSYSSANTTELNIFSLLYGINSTAFANFEKDSIPSMAMQTLRKSGYATYGYSASSLRNWLGAGFIFKNFDSYKEFLSDKPYNDDSVMIENLKREYQQNDHSKPALYYAFLVSTHHNYYYPPSFERHKPVAKQDLEFYEFNNYSSDIKLKMINRYKNSVTYADYNVKKIYSIFKKQFDSNNLVVIITGDHGEEFWDHGLVGHSANNLYNCRTVVPLYFYLPGQKELNFTITSNTEIMPTLLDYLGMKQEKTKSYFDYPSLLKQTDDNAHRFVVVSGCDFKKQRKACIISENKKYWVTVKERNILIDKSFLINDSSLSNPQKDFKLRDQLRKTINLCNRYFAN